MTSHQIIRERLLVRAGILKPPMKRKPCLGILRKQEWLPEFEQLMRNRLIMGSIRYGSITREDLGGYELMKSIRARLTLYEETGNLEPLVDAACLIMYEYKFSSHPKKHFHATDDGQHVSKANG